MNSERLIFLSKQLNKKTSLLHSLCRPLKTDKQQNETFDRFGATESWRKQAEKIMILASSLRSSVEAEEIP